VSVSGTEPLRTGPCCQSAMHASCPHKIGGGVRLFRGRGAFALLCNCNCHSACPLAGQPQVADEEWVQECTCSGADSLREIHHRFTAEADLLKSQQEEVFRDLDLGHGKSPEQIQREILAAYGAKGYVAPSDFSRISRFAAAGSARRGTRTVRLLSETVGSVRAARNWADDNIPENDRADNEKELGRMRRSAGTLSALAVTAALSAHFTRGFLRVGLILLSVLLGALAAWVGLWVSALGLISPSRRSGVDTG
jgi:hypothetical protein